MPQRSPHRPVFDPRIRRGQITTGSAIGTERTNVNASTVTLPISIPTPTVTTPTPPQLSNYTIVLSGGGSYSGNSASIAVNSGDFLLTATVYRGSGTQAAPAPAVGGAGVQLSGLTSVYANADFDTAGTSRGASRFDRATAASTGTMADSGGGGDNGSSIMNFGSSLSGAPTQTNRSTLDATDSCNISLPSPPGANGKVLVVVVFGPAGNGANLNPAAPSGWTKQFDHSFNTKAIMLFTADSPQQTFTYSLTAGTTTNGGRDVMIAEW